MSKVNNKDTRERRQWRRSVVLIVKFEHISELVTDIKHSENVGRLLNVLYMFKLRLGSRGLNGYVIS